MKLSEKKSKTSWTIGFGLLAALTCGMSGGLPPSELRIGVVERPNGNHPSLWGHAPSRGPIQWTHDTLFEFEYLRSAPTLRPLLAAEPVRWSGDKKRGILQLKSGVLFGSSTGRALLASDLMESWNRMSAMNSSNSTHQHFFSNLKSIRVLAPLILEFELRAPDPDFEFKLTLPFTAPFQESSQTQSSGAGPWMLETWHPGKMAVFEARKGYSNSFFPTEADEAPRQKGLIPSIEDSGALALPRTDRIKQIWFEKSQDALEAFKHGELDILPLNGPLSTEVLLDPAGATIKPALTSLGIRLEQALTSEFTFAILNLRTLKSASTRRAILAALNSDFWKSAIRAETDQLGSEVLPRLEDWSYQAPSSKSRKPQRKRTQTQRMATPIRVDWVTPSADFVAPLEALKVLTDRLEKEGLSMSFESHTLAESKQRFLTRETDVLILAWDPTLPTLRELISPLKELQPAENPEIRKVFASLQKADLHHLTALTQALEGAAVWSVGPRQRRRWLVQPWVFGCHLQSHFKNPEKFFKVDRALRKNYERAAKH